MLKLIPGFNGYYKAGTDGSLLSWYSWGGGNGSRRMHRTKWHKLKPHHNHRTGRLTVRLFKNGKKRHYLVHRLVLFTFAGPCPPGMECRHFPDRDPTNCGIDNLRYGTKSENQMDRVLHGTSNRGEQNGSAKLTRQNVWLIRRLWITGDYTMRQLADLFIVSPGTICHIVNHKTWV